MKGRDIQLNNVMMDMEKIRRDEFPVTQSRIFFDHARVAPLPRRVEKAACAFVKDASENGTVNYADWLSRADRVREQFARLIHAENDEVAFVKNTTEGISMVANGLDWKAGDNVVIPDVEFPSNVYPWMNLQRLGVETRFVRAIDGRVLFDDIVSRVDARTRIISVSSVEFSSGFRNDLNKIGAFCRERNILFFVDAIQSLGVLPMDVKGDCIDFLAADGHKWLLSVEGLGGFYISRRVMDRVRPVTVGWSSVVGYDDFMNYDFTLRPGARRFEEGSANALSIHAFGAALSLFEEIGIETIESRVMELGVQILAGLKRRKIKIFSSVQKEERSGIVSFVLDADPDKFSAFMESGGVTLTVRGRLARLSPHFYNTSHEVERFFELLDEWQKL
jgi:selenocysteine lyase/cysteine desulfurase